VPRIDVVFYKEDDGRVPVLEWLAISRKSKFESDPEGHTYEEV
jgi:hypothetical protein